MGAGPGGGRLRTLTGPSRRLTIRRTTALLALATAAVQVAVLVITEQVLRDAVGGSDITYPVSGFRWVWIALAPLPWLVGGLLVLAGRAHLGTGVVVAATALFLPAGLRSLSALADAGPSVSGPAALVIVGGQPAVLLLGLLSMAAALWSRPRQGWRTAAPGPVGVYVAVAVLAWLPTALQTLELAPPGAMRSFARTELSRLVGMEAGASVAYAVVVAALLLVAPRLRPEVAGAVLLVYAVPQLADAVGDLVQVRVTEHLILTPPAVLGDVGLVGLIALAVWWIGTAGRRHAVVARAAADPSAPDGHRRPTALPGVPVGP
ncbi:MAG: hypothetical protein ACNA8R_15510 [Nitriliruptoraceae bacterium]